MTLENFVGIHKLSGLDQKSIKEKDAWGNREELEVFLFILDGTTWQATEDPSDGYRSYLRQVVMSSEKVDYTFPEVEVEGRMMNKTETDFWDNNNDVIIFKDIKSGKDVLEFGTINVDDYYPSCYMSWRPENLSINEQNRDTE
jgi:hypothetical protein